MFSCRCSLALTVAALLVATTTTTLAQSRAAGSPSDAAPGSAAGARHPGDPRAAVPAVTYSSAFARYRSIPEPELGNWRSSNDNVGRIGGWRVYGKEASEPAAAGAQPGGGKPAAAPRHPHGHQQ